MMRKRIWAETWDKTTPTFHQWHVSGQAQTIAPTDIDWHYLKDWEGGLNILLIFKCHWSYCIWREIQVTAFGHHQRTTEKWWILTSYICETGNTTQARKVQNWRKQGGEFQDPVYLELSTYCLRLIIQGDNDVDRNKSRRGLEPGVSVWEAVLGWNWRSWTGMLTAQLTEMASALVLTQQDNLDCQILGGKVSNYTLEHLTIITIFHVTNFLITTIDKVLPVILVKLRN